MSRFFDSLERIDRGATTSMGFGAVVRPEKVPAMGLVGTLSKLGKSAAGAANLAKVGADAALLQDMDAEKIPDRLVKALGEVPWGIKVAHLDEKQAILYKDQGCDFLAFQPEGVLLEALSEDEDPGYILCIQPDMAGRSLRAIEQLPVDAVLLSLKPEEPPLTLQHLITIGAIRSAFSKYLLLEVPPSLTTRELDGLREIGVDSLVVDADAHSVEELEGLKDRLMNLPKRQQKPVHQGQRHPSFHELQPATGPGPRGRRGGIRRGRLARRPRVDKVAIIGTGLIGTSLGLAIKQSAIKKVEIVGTDRDRSRAHKAQSMGALDHTTGSLPNAVEDAEIVIIATPVMVMKDLMEIIASHLSEGCLVTDTGGSKGEVIEWAERYLPPKRELRRRPSDSQQGSFRTRGCRCQPLSGAPLLRHTFE